MTEPLPPSLSAPVGQDGMSLHPSEILRTETVLSRLPLHQLAKHGHVTIQLTTQDARGRCTVYWEVLPNAAFGAPGPLAYKLDTLVINQRLDAQPKPLPKLVRLGSLRAL